MAGVNKPIDGAASGQDPVLLPVPTEGDPVALPREEKGWPMNQGTSGSDAPRRAPSPPTVCIITFCRDLAYLYGTLTTLQTIRKGFPTARVLACDNGSLPEAQRTIQRAAATADAHFLQLVSLGAPPLPHWDILRALVLNEHLLDDYVPDALRGPLVILDGDCLFWEPCEAWPVDGLLAGRLVPARVTVHPVPPTAVLGPTPAPAEETAVLLPRLHTSFWWIPDRETLCHRIRAIQTTHPTWDPFTPWMVPDPSGGPRWYVGDTASNLYGAIQQDCVPFAPAQLDGYDHLFAGSSPTLIASLCAHPFPGYDWFPRVHAAAQRGDFAAIRGVWREQEAYFTRSGGSPR